MPKARFRKLTAGTLLILVAVAPVTRADPAADLDRIRKENERLKAEIERLRKVPAPPPAPAAPPPLVKVEPGCMMRGSAKYCTGWAVTVYSVDARAHTSAPVGRFVPKDASHIGIDAHADAFSFGASELEYRGEGLFNALQGGEYSFVAELSRRRYDRCEASLALSGESILLVTNRAATGSAVRSLQPGLYPIAFRFTCSLYQRAGGTPPTLGLRVLSQRDGAPRPFLISADPAESEIVRKAR